MKITNQIIYIMRDLFCITNYYLICNFELSYVNEGGLIEQLTQAGAD